MYGINEGFFGGAFGAGGDDDTRGDIFDQFEREFERMPRTPQPPSQPRRRAPPANPPHYSFHPSNDKGTDWCVVTTVVAMGWTDGRCSCSHPLLCSWTLTESGVCVCVDGF